MTTYGMGLLPQTHAPKGFSPLNGIIFLLLSLCLLLPTKLFATGETGTYFNFFVPPNNEVELRDVNVVVTAIYDSTYFRIEDTGEDGDTDDSAYGMLMAGQSYILFLRDNGINDDAPHAGEQGSKQDGDHFIVSSSKLVYVSQSTASDWQHNWLPADNKSSKGQKFYLYTGKVTSSPNDINVMAYQDSTFVTVTKVSSAPTLMQGYTQLSNNHNEVVLQRMISPGKDLIYYFHEGRDVLQPGETYLVQANKDVTVQYGALYGHEHDGGGYVPSSNGTSEGSLFYFAVPFEDSAQQEIRIISNNPANDVVLDRYQNGQWVNVRTFNNLAINGTAEWVGAVNNETYGTIFRLRCSSGKRVSVFEANWVETGGMNTSDIAAMATSNEGSSAGNDFLVYMPIPCAEGNITDPFTGNKMPAKATHAYIFGNPNSPTHVTVKDAFTNGGVINRSYNIPANYYADFMLDSIQWQSIYNGNGQMSSGPQRPYVTIHTDKLASVMISNHNNDWTTYMGSSQGQHFHPLPTVTHHGDFRDGDSTDVYTNINFNCSGIDDAHLGQDFDDGLDVHSATLCDSTNHTAIPGTIVRDNNTGITHVTFPSIAHLDSTHYYCVHNVVAASSHHHRNLQITANTLLSISTYLSGAVDSLNEMANGTITLLVKPADSLCNNLDASFTASSNNVETNQNVEFIANCNSCNYTWDLGIGQTKVGNDITYDFGTAGNYTVTLQVQDTLTGCMTSSSETVLVNEPKNTGIAQENISTPIKIWSAGNKVYANFNETGNADAVVSIYNEAGQMISSENAGAANIYSKEILSTSAEYVFIIINNNQTVTRKKVFISNVK